MLSAAQNVFKHALSIRPFCRQINECQRDEFIVRPPLSLAWIEVECRCHPPPDSTGWSGGVEETYFLRRT